MPVAVVLDQSHCFMCLFVQEQVDLQLEVQYRERLADIFEQVTRRLVGVL